MYGQAQKNKQITHDKGIGRVSQLLPFINYGWKWQEDFLQKLVIYS